MKETVLRDQALATGAAVTRVPTAEGTAVAVTATTEVKAVALAATAEVKAVALTATAEVTAVALRVRADVNVDTDETPGRVDPMTRVDDGATRTRSGEYLSQSLKCEYGIVVPVAVQSKMAWM